jgi:S-adenosylmethionine decarboxylase
MDFKSDEEGSEVTAIFNGVDSDKFSDSELLKETSLKLLKDVGFTILGSSEHKFSPQGYTFMVLLAESHFAAHTYPEYSTIYFHLYTCGKKDIDKIISGLKKFFEPKSVILRKEAVRVKFN